MSAGATLGQWMTSQKIGEDFTACDATRVHAELPVVKDALRVVRPATTFTVA